MRRAASALVLLAGCGAFESWKYKLYPPNPFTDIRVVAVLPVLNQSLEPHLDGREFGNIIASELAKFEGVRVVRPQVLLPPGSAPASLEDLLSAARLHKADAVFIAAATDYDPYDPPRIALSVQFLRASGRALSAAEIDRLVQSASWRRGPIPLGREGAGHFLAAFEDVYDAHEERIRSEIVQYAQAQDPSDTPYAGEREFLAVQPRFKQFVANQAIRRAFELALTP
jgi:hypothetical protein